AEECAAVDHKFALRAVRGTQVCACALTEQARVSAMQSQVENYRAKAKEFARLMIVAKSLRHSRQYRKLAEMYWALAIGEESDRAQPSKTTSKGPQRQRQKERNMTTYPVEFHRRLEQKWATRIDQTLTVAANATPPRDPDDDDDEEDEEDEEAEERDDGPPVVREPERDE